MGLTLLIVLLIGWISIGLLAGWVATTRGRDGCSWFVAGVFLGPIALLAVGLAAPAAKPATDTPLDGKVCPRCGESVKLAAEVCRFCGHEFIDTHSAQKPGEPAVDFGRWRVLTSKDAQLPVGAFVSVGVGDSFVRLASPSGQRTVPAETVSLEFQGSNAWSLRIGGRESAVLEPAADAPVAALVRALSAAAKSKPLTEQT